MGRQRIEHVPVNIPIPEKQKKQRTVNETMINSKFENVYTVLNLEHLLWFWYPIILIIELQVTLPCTDFGLLSNDIQFYYIQYFSYLRRWFTEKIGDSHPQIDGKANTHAIPSSSMVIYYFPSI